jgi:ABC-type polysaccharide/polyol phosphate export permease
VTASDVWPMPDVPDSPPAEYRFRRAHQLRRAPVEVWQARLVIRSLVERELRALYKQAALGAAWAVLVPVTLMVVFTVFLQRVANIDTGGVPYALFSYIGLVPWSFFASSATSGGMSIVQQMSLVNKIRCPREVFPLASVTVAAVNACIATLVLLLLFVLNRFAPKATTPLAVFPLVVMVVFTVAVTLYVSAFTVYVRDLRHALPILLQLGLFATPVVYGLDTIPEAWRPWYCLVDPMAPVIDSFRQTVLYGNAPNWLYLGLGACTSVVLLVTGMSVFRRLEAGFADVA